MRPYIILALALGIYPLFAEAAKPALPGSIKVETARLKFQVAPLIPKGTLAEQVRQSLKYLWNSGKDAKIVRLRAFVAGGGDSRQVPAIIAEAFSRKHLPLPVVNVIRVGALAEPSSQVVLESVSLSSKVENPNGLVFLSGQLTSIPKDPREPLKGVSGLAEKSLANVKGALGAMNLEPTDALRISCFTSSLQDYPLVRKLIADQFPAAATNIVQIQRAAETQEVECEAVARLRNRSDEPVRLINPTQAAFAQAALVTAPEIILTATHTAPGSDDTSIRKAFQGLSATLHAAGSALDTVFYSSAYPVNAASLQKYRDVRWEYFQRARAPASTNLVFEGLPEPGETLGIDVIALPGH